MKIAIIVDDRTIVVDGVACEVELNWQAECFTGDPGTVLDDVHAVQFDTDAGQGHVEYRTVRTKQLTRPNNVPPNWAISALEFEQLFGWVLPHYREALEKRKAQEEAARAAAREAAANAPERPAPAPPEDVSALKAELEQLRGIVDAHRSTFERINAVLPEGG